MLQAKQCLITTSSIATPISLINVLQKKVEKNECHQFHKGKKNSFDASELQNYSAE